MDGVGPRPGEELVLERYDPLELPRVRYQGKSVVVAGVRFSYKPGEPCVVQVDAAAHDQSPQRTWTATLATSDRSGHVVTAIVTSTGDVAWS